MTTRQACRLPQGGLIDRARPLRFTFEGRHYAGYEGDTLASALLANGVSVVGRSFKYHRPRGIMAAGVEESNALVQLGTGARSTPNMRATEVPLHEGLEARAVNCWPSVDFDLGRVNDLFSRFLGAGFYYKTFMWPDWHLYEGFIRKAAGLGKPSDAPDPDRYDQRFAHCDVLVIGSGPAGLAAAASAAATGARVILAEQDSRLGGTLLWDGGEIDGQPGPLWAGEVEARLRAAPDVRVLTATAATGYFDHNAVSLVETVGGENPAPGQPRYRHWQVRAGKVILATGAIERPLVFPGNDRPGVILAGAVRHYIARYAVRPGNRAVIFTNNDDAYRTAAAFHAAGGTIAAVVDTRVDAPAVPRRAIEALGITVHAGAAIIATRGNKRIKSATARLADGSRRELRCDVLACSGGANPAVHLFSQSGGKLRFDDSLQTFVPAVSVQAEASVGAANGARTLSEALAAGHAAGGSTAAAPLATQEQAPAELAPCWAVDAPGKAFVDFLNDVTTGDIALAKRENFTSVEHLKRYTTLGMGTDQGKTANVNALAIMAQLTGQPVSESGTTRYRYPYVPVAFGALGGRNTGELLRPRRHLPMHDWHVGHGADMDDYGWQRPAAYPLPGEDRHAACLREARVVRSAVGLFDGSPLGKIEVRGPDAARFLDFIYANTISTLQPGKVRYGLMLDERGVIIDDGVCARLGDDHFLVGSSSAGADRIAGWLEEWLQCEFLEHGVLVAPVTTSWAVITLTGPAARAVLANVGTNIDLSTEAFPHMSMRTGEVMGIEARVFRVSYTGEASYEINVPVSRAPELWERLFAAGQAHGIAPIGIEAWNLLRLEKGFLHVGADTDGTTTPLNVGWSRVLKRKADFVGKRSLTLPVHRQERLLELVGLKSAGAMLPIGAHLVTGQGATRRSDGFVTSSAQGIAVGEPVALALVHGGQSRIGETVELDHLGQVFRAEICDYLRYDPEGARLHA